MLIHWSRVTPKCMLEMQHCCERTWEKCPDSLNSRLSVYECVNGFSGISLLISIKEMYSLILWSSSFLMKQASVLVFFECYATWTPSIAYANILSLNHHTAVFDVYLRKITKWEVDLSISTPYVLQTAHGESPYRKYTDYVYERC